MRSRVPIIPAMAAVAALAVPAAASATTGTASITGGSLSMVAPPAVGFTATLDGTDQTVSSPQLFGVLDATGSGAGWNITATSTTFTAGADTLPATATTVPAAPTPACDASATCAPAVTTVTYPYTLPAGATPPTATKLYNAMSATGLGSQTATATVRLAIPASTRAGTYTSTWFYSLVSGP